MNDATVLVVGDLAWPLVVLVLVCVLLATQRKPIGELISRIRSFTVPGGGAELAPAVSEGEADTILALVDRLTRNVSERADLGDVRAADDDDVVDNREPKAEFEPLRDEEVTNLVMLRTKLTNLLSELTVPPPPGGFGAVTATIDVLVGRGVLDTRTAQLLRDTVVVADQAAAGATVPHRVAVAVENSGSAILEQLAVLRTTAAASFEYYVLDQLQDKVPDGWAVDLDRSIPAALSGTTSAQPQGRARHTWVDALVRASERSAVVEVRARLQPSSAGQIESVRSWVEALPGDLPILLVMLGDGLTVREQQLIEGGREGSLRILLWDLEADRLMPELRRLLAGSSIDLLSVPLQS